MRTATFRFVLSLGLLLEVACAGARSVETGSGPAVSNGSTVVLLVRHGEKASGSDDPSLTPAGKQRAEALAGVAADAGVRTVYSTQLHRTRETAQPLAERVGVPVTVRDIPPGQDGARTHADAMARELLELPRGGTVLVVEHSNTLPQIIETLTGVRIAPIPDSEYDNLFIVVLPPSGQGRLIRAKYGAPGTP